MSRTCCVRASASSVSRNVKSNWPSAGSTCSHAIGTLTVLAPSFFTAGHTLGSIGAHALELFTCAPSTRYGAPSTISAERPLRVTSSGIGAAAAIAVQASAQGTKHTELRIEPPAPARCRIVLGSSRSCIGVRMKLLLASMLALTSLAAVAESPARKDVLALAARAADWQLAHM